MSYFPRNRNTRIIISSSTLTIEDEKIVVNNGATNIIITFPIALSNLGKTFEISRGGTSTGSITLQATGTQFQSVNGTIGATTSIANHGANGQGLNHYFTSFNIGGVGTYMRI